MRVLVTGGAGFIGSHIVDALVARKHRVIVLDSLHPQIHPTGRRPAYLSAKAGFVRGDVRTRRILADLIPRVDAVIHQAARVGVGQSMYEINEYVDANTRGTALLLDVLTSVRNRVKKLLIASSMSIYGEGSYRCPSCGPVQVRDRREEDLKRRRFEPYCSRHRKILRWERTPETKSIVPTSIYASTKRDQEEMCLMIGRAYGIPTVAIRYFNVYGPRQALSNPYTGVLAIFGSRLLNDNPPLIFEDGGQARDFVHVRDIAAANLAALERAGADGCAVNCGTGRPVTVRQVAEDLARAMVKSIRPVLLGDFRVGDIRHCIADNREIRRRLGWTPRISWSNGLAEYAAYLRTQTAVDRVDNAIRELEQRRLRRKSSR